MAYPNSMTPDNYPSVEYEPLTLHELSALEYWKRFLPKTVAALERQGPDALETAIRAAAWRLEYNVLLQKYLNPDLPEEIAEELFRAELYPPPEPGADPDRDL